MAYAGTARRSAGWRVFLFVAAAVPGAPATPAEVQPTPSRGEGRVALAGAYGTLPLRFEPNVGQMDARFGFRSRAAGHDLYLAPDEAVIAVRGAAEPVRIRLAGGRTPRRIAGEAVLPGHTNYYLGDDAGRWRTHVAAYGRVRYEQVYPGVDLVYYGSERQLEYDFVVAPGADPSAIVLSVTGVDRLRLSPEGDLVLEVRVGEIRQRRPVLYQERDGQRHAVDGRYVMIGKQEVGFRVGPYDRSRPLIIDPVITLAYSTYFGGSAHENTIYSGVAVDAVGAAYIVGNSYSPDLPGAVPGSKPGGASGDVFVAKINPAGNAIEYATYIGGSVDEEGHDIAVDPAGNAYVVGFVHHPATGFPVLNAFQPTLAGGLGDAIVAKLNPDGTLFYSSFLGGRGAGIDRSYERAHAVAADADGHMYVTGITSSSIGFPIVGGVQTTLRGGFDVFVTKVSPAGQSLVFSTFVGGTLSDHGYNIAIDAERAVYVAGNTLSVDNPATPANEGMPVVNAFQPVHGGGNSDAFVFKLNPAGDQLVFSTYLGGTRPESDDATLVAPTGGVAVDAQGYVYVAGHTQSANFPTTPNLLHPYTGSQDLFITKLTPEGNQLVYSTFLGGAGVVDVCLGLAVDARGSAYVTGYSNRGFPLLNALPMYAGILNTNNGTGFDAIVAKLSPDGGSLAYSTYLGGRMRDQAHDIALDTNGHAYITGVTYALTFPLESALDTVCTGCTEGGQFEGSSEAFLAKIFLTNAAPVALGDSFSTEEDVALMAAAPGVLANDSDVNPQDVPVATLVAAPLHGALALAADGSLTYTPAPDFSGTDTFTYKASDGLLESAPATVTITVLATNDPPAAEAGGPYSVDEGDTVTLIGTGTDGEGDALTFDWDLDGDGVFESPGETATFVAGDGPASATVFLRATDTAGAVGMDSAPITVRNVAPLAGADAFATDEDAPLTVGVPGLLANDTDFDPLTAVLVAGPAHGTLTLGVDGSFHYVPAADFNGTDGFTYRAHDGVDSSGIVSVALTVTPVNDVPTAGAGGPYTANEGQAVALAGSGSDLDGDALAFAWDLDGDGTFETAGQTPSLFVGNGPATLTVALRVSDGQGGTATSSAVVTVINLAPVALADALSAVAGTPLQVAAPGVLANDHDFDALSAVLVAAPAQGTLTLGSDGAVHYLAGAGASGTDTFTYRAHDGDVLSAPATVTITIQPTQGGAPDALDDLFVVKKRRHRPHMFNVLGNDSAGAGGSPLTIVAVTQPPRGHVHIGPHGKTVIYQAAKRFRGIETFTYTIRNASGETDTATVTVKMRKRGGHGRDDDDGDDDDGDDGDCDGGDHQGHDD
jgi:hypothetical protein